MPTTPASPAITIPADVQLSNSPFSQSDLTYALSQWQSLLRNQHEEFERGEGERKRRNGKLKESYGSVCDAKGYRSVQTRQPYIEKLVVYASKSFILHPINIGLIYSAGRANYPSNEASYNFEYVLGVLHGPFDTSRLPYFTDTNRGC